MLELFDISKIKLLPSDKSSPELPFHNSQISQPTPPPSQPQSKLQPPEPITLPTPLQKQPSLEKQPSTPSLQKQPSNQSLQPSKVVNSKPQEQSRNTVFHISLTKVQMKKLKSSNLKLL